MSSVIGVIALLLFFADLVLLFVQPHSTNNNQVMEMALFLIAAAICFK